MLRLRYYVLMIRAGRDFVPFLPVGYFRALLTLQRKVHHGAGFQRARPTISMQARCLRYELKTTLRCSARQELIPFLGESPGFLDSDDVEHGRCDQDGFRIRGPVLPVLFESFALLGSEEASLLQDG